MSFFRDAVEWAREAITGARVAYAIGLGVSGAMGHCVAIASVAPRVSAVEAELADIRARVELDRRVLDRVEGMTEGIAASLGVQVPPPVSRAAEVQP
jgi:hypothetical protein